MESCRCGFTISLLIQADENDVGRIVNKRPCVGEVTKQLVSFIYLGFDLKLEEAECFCKYFKLVANGVDEGMTKVKSHQPQDKFIQWCTHSSGQAFHMCLKNC